MKKYRYFIYKSNVWEGIFRFVEDNKDTEFMYFSTLYEDKIGVWLNSSWKQEKIITECKEISEDEAFLMLL